MDMFLTFNVAILRGEKLAQFGAGRLKILDSSIDTEFGTYFLFVKTDFLLPFLCPGEGMERIVIQILFGSVVNCAN